MHLPVFFDGQLLRCLVVGGGPSVLRKIELFLEAGASVTVIAPQADFKVVVLSSLARVKWEQRAYQAGECEGFDLVVIGAEDVPTKAEIALAARKMGIPVNVSGDPALSTYFIPAVVREGEMTVAVSSGGQAPFMAVEFVRRLGSAVKGWGMWIALAARFRAAVNRNTKDPTRRKEYYEKFVLAGPIQLEPEPDERTSIAEWLQIIHHARFGPKPVRPGAPVREGLPGSAPRLPPEDVAPPSPAAETPTETPPEASTADE